MINLLDASGWSSSSCEPDRDEPATAVHDKSPSPPD
jgi:hypothetical protein